MQFAYSQVFVRGISPVTLPHLLVHPLGRRLGKSVSYKLHHHLEVFVVVEVLLQPYIHRCAEYAHTVGNALTHRSYEVGDT